MSRSHHLRLAFCLVFLAVNHACAAPNPINTLIFDVDLERLAVLAEDQTRAFAARDQIDSDAPAAVMFAKKYPDLAKAVKDYYAAAAAYSSIGVSTDISEAAHMTRLTADLDSKEKSLHLEMKLAGIK